MGGLTERKDPLGLLQAVARLRATHPEVRVAFVGDGPLAASIAPAARHLGIPAGHVIRAGALPHPQVARWVAAADVLSMVSRVEPLGVVALEALAAGRPVVATAVGGAREVVPARGPGRIVDPGNPARHAAAMAELLDHPPTPDACRGVAVGGAVEHQAARVEAVLARAAATRAAGSLRRQ
ncbi:MAG: glycosyltransferase [Thermoleophilia bacterium]